MEILKIPIIGRKIKWHILKTIPIPIRPIIQTVSVLKVCAITLLTDKKTSAIHIQETIMDKIFTTSFIMPFLNPFLTLHIVSNKIINKKTIFKSISNTFLNARILHLSFQFNRINRVCRNYNIFIRR